jgi:thiol-disulfide isomerase/thioredoxin
MQSSIYRILLFILLIPEVVASQKIKIGQTFPDIVLPNVINYPESSLKLSSFRNKIVLLDFWNHSCSACVGSFPKLDSLQRIFDGKIQIILVNKESKDSTERLFKRHKTITKPSVPMITGDQRLFKLIPPEGYPYSVWIDRKGIVRYFSASYHITKSYINEFLTQSN